MAEHLYYEDDDIVLVVDGRERSGKSTAARQISCWLSLYFGLDFNNDNIHFDVEKYMKNSRDFNRRTENKVKGYVNVLDESRADLYKRRSMNNKLMRFTDYLTAVGKWRQIHILVLPAFHDLDKYITRWRMKFLINIYKVPVNDEKRFGGKRFKKGAYKVYSINELRKNINHLVRDFSYPRYAEVAGDRPFNNYEVFSEEQLKKYEEEKDQYIGKIVDGDEEEESEIDPETERRAFEMMRKNMKERKREENYLNI